MRTVKLLKPMDYKGEPHKTGDVVEVENDVAAWLIKNGGAVAARRQPIQEHDFKFDKP